MIFKCKPVWQFQSVEFDFDVKDATVDLPAMFEIYKRVLKGLMDFAPEQQKQSVNREPLASEKQRQIMKANGIPFTPTTTMSEASQLIKASVDSARQ